MIRKNIIVCKCTRLNTLGRSEYNWMNKAKIWSRVERNYQLLMDITTSFWLDQLVFDQLMLQCKSELYKNKTAESPASKHWWELKVVQLFGLPVHSSSESFQLWSWCRDRDIKVCNSLPFQQNLVVSLFWRCSWFYLRVWLELLLPIHTEELMLYGVSWNFILSIIQNDIPLLRKKITCIFFSLSNAGTWRFTELRRNFQVESQ